jgi:hypothetical protein
MLHVELDVFSGRPNPKWTLTSSEELELVDRIMADKSAIRKVDDVESILGYRGMVISAADSSGSDRLSALALPKSFRVRQQTMLDVSSVTERWLLATQGSEDLSQGVRAHSEASVSSAPLVSQSPQAGANSGSVAPAAACVIWWTSNSDFSFWNSNPTLSTNNCYNFASNLATNTFAQPGRGSGTIFSSLTVSNIKSAMYRDGYKSSCSGNNFKVYLVIWPGNDFHFYREVADAAGGAKRWAHKPGATPARNYDNSGIVISNPVTCNRGPYTISGEPYVFGPLSPQVRIQ